MRIHKLMLFLFSFCFISPLCPSLSADSGSSKDYSYSKDSTDGAAVNTYNADYPKVNPGSALPPPASGFLYMYSRYWKPYHYSPGIFLEVENSRILERGAISCRFNQDPIHINEIALTSSPSSIHTAYVIDNAGNIVEQRRDLPEKGWSTYAENCVFDESKMNSVVRGNRNDAENARQACVRINCDFQFENPYANGAYIVGKINTVPFRP